MRGGAVTLARKFKKLTLKPELVVLSDMMDVSAFIALLREELTNVPIVTYFHETQFSYPLSPKEKHRNIKAVYGSINWLSALSSDWLIFNSNYHKETFAMELKSYLSSTPEYQELQTITEIINKSSVIPVGIDSIELGSQTKSQTNLPPTILWNHRWEHDKNAEEFFEVLETISNMGIEFQLAVLGEQTHTEPEYFNKAKQTLSDKIIHWGYAKDKSDYVKWLWKSDILPVTSEQDFLGLSILEAMHCGCFHSFRTG